MWPYTKKSVRRKEIRRTRTERGLTWHQRLGSPRSLLRILIPAVAAILSAFLVNVGGDVLNIRVGQTIPRALTSRVDFSVENQARTIEMCVQARDNAENYYEMDVSLLKDIRGRLTAALQLAKEHAADPEQFHREAQKNKIILDADGQTELLRIATLTDPDELAHAVERFQAAVDRAIYKLGDQPPLLVEAIEPYNLRTAVNAILVDPRPAEERPGPQQRPLPVGQLLYSNQSEAADAVAEAAAQTFGQPLRGTMQASIRAILEDEESNSIKPLFRYLPERSHQAAQDAYNSVPTQFDIYPRGRRLTPAGAITEDGLRLLQREQKAWREWIRTAGTTRTPQELEQLRADDPRAYEQVVAEQAAARQTRHARQLSRLGYSLLVFAVVIALAIHLGRPRRGVRVEPVQYALAAVLLLGMLALARMLYVTTSAAHYAVGAQAFAAALLAIVFSRGRVSAATGGLALLVTLATRQGMGFFLILLTVSMTLLYGLRDVRNRGKIVSVGAIAACVALITAIATGLIDSQALSFIFRKQALLAGSTTLAAAFIIEGILPGIERLFKISTSMTLLEWCDASKPLMRLLAAESPGTYNHSLLVGSLAEAAAEAIGANGLLARTGAYYHDIGKINKPEYFAENQSMAVSRHDRLSPAMSHLIIIGHVKDGIEMAQEYGLPASLHPFIPEHHGTTLVEYFYHAASQQRKPGDREVSDVQFRYLGPKPQTREAAIMMLCDGVEGAVRAMPEPTPNRIEDTVTKISRRRLMDGQFDDCELTFRELEIIERSLVKSLCAIYHSRVAYPEREEPKKDESRAS
ncbi:MAG: HDIG domain-containing metalloprotein [Planctomycetota bacterium]